MEMNSFTISFLMIIQTIHIFEKHSTVTRRAKEYGIDIQARGKTRGDRTKTYQNAHVSGRLEIEWGKIP